MHGLIKIYNDVARELVKKFKENYNKYDMGDDSILKGGPLQEFFDIFCFSY